MSAKKKQPKEVKLTEGLYEAIRSPIITEKATLGQQYNQYTFRVPVSARKGEIRKAVEALFNVQVVKVNTSIQLGKTKIFKGRQAFRSDRKRAIVTLAEGQSIDTSMGV
jgi:large subunit ribosomal protein L23